MNAINIILGTIFGPSVSNALEHYVLMCETCLYSMRTFDITSTYHIQRAMHTSLSETSNTHHKRCLSIDYGIATTHNP